MLANLLGTHGASALLVERNPSTGNEPRAVSIDDESLRTTHTIGLGDAVLRSLVPGYGSDYLTPGGRCFLTVEPLGKPYGFPRRSAFRQPLLEAQLQQGATRFSTIATSYGWSLTKFDQDRDGVTAWLNDNEGGVRVVRCKYLIGCDGAGSTVRRELGVKLEGETFAERWLIVDLANSPSQRGNTIVYCDPKRPCIALPGPDLTRRFEFKLRADERDEEMLRSEVVQQLLRAHGAHPGSTLVRKVVYTFHARVAARWSDRRVFLAGDAAHLTPPFAGQGMNSGIRDSSNLAWKLAFVTSARLSSAILATYEMAAGGWRFGKLTPLLIYGTVNAGLSLLTPAQSSATWSASLRYDIVRNVALKAQFSNPQALNVAYFAAPNFASSERVNVVSVGLDFVF